MSIASIIVKLAEIVWFPEWNVSRLPGQSIYRNDADRDSVIRALLPGWQLTQTLKGCHITKEQAERAVKDREAYCQQLKADIESGAADYKISLSEGSMQFSAADLLATCQRMWCDDKGRFLRPKYVGICGFRRSGTFQFVNTVAAKQKRPAITEIPLVVEDYATEVDRMAACIMENTTQGLGRRGLSSADLLNAGRSLFQNGAKESDIIRAVTASKRGAGQKMFKTLQLDAAFPGLKLVDGILADKEGASRYGSLTWKELSELHKLGANPDAEAKVKAYFADPKGGEGNEPKIMAKPDIKALAEQCPVEVLKAAFNAVLKNDKSGLAKFIAKAAAINAAVEAALK
jgi:hypothetical protein